MHDVSGKPSSKKVRSGGQESPTVLAPIVFFDQSAARKPPFDVSEPLMYDIGGLIG